MLYTFDFSNFLHANRCPLRSKNALAEQSDRRFGDHEPQYAQDCAESREAEHKPGPEEDVITGGQRRSGLVRSLCQVAHPHLHDDNWKPEDAYCDIEDYRQDDPALTEIVSDLP